ncbi:MAG TPA: S-layer homology domain-containing protein, partial [Clostridia bacterium]
QLAIPPSIIKVDELSKLLNVSSDKVKISIGIAEVPKTEALEVISKATTQDPNLKAIGGRVLEFSIEARSDTQVIKIDNFGQTKVKGEMHFTDRDIAGVKDIKNINVYKYNPDTGKMEYRKSIVDPVNKKVVFYTPGFSQYTMMENDRTFDDVNSHWAKKYIETLASKYIVNGTDNGVFNPDGKVTRAEFATILVNALDIQAGTDSAQTFGDVPVNAWFNNSIARAYKAGLVNGVGNNQFNPNAPITREQIALMTMNAYKYLSGKDFTSVTSNKGQFADAGNISGWAKQAVTAAGALGIVNGMNDNSFAPAKNASRAEGTTMIYRLLTYTGDL